MASAAEQLVSNLNFSAFSKASELKRRIWFTLGALLVYRLGTYIPMPGIDPVELAKAFEQSRSSLLGMFNMFSGGAVGRMAIFALGIMPYISASIIMQLMTSVSTQLAALKKEGEAGRKKINQYTRYATVLLATVQAYGLAVGLEGSGNIVLDPGWFFRATTVITLVGGTMFLLWLGEQITARGVGNGTSLIIFAGIVADLPGAIAGLFELNRTGSLGTLTLLVLFVLFVGRHRGRRLHGAGAAAAAGELSQAPGRQQDDAGRCLASAAEAQLGRRHSADLRVLALAAALDFRAVPDRAGDDHLERLAEHVAGLDRLRCAAPHDPLRTAHRLLLLLLYGDRDQSGGDGGQSQEVRRLHSGHPPGREDGRSTSTMS